MDDHHLVAATATLGDFARTIIGSVWSPLKDAFVAVCCDESSLLVALAMQRYDGLYEVKLCMHVYNDTRWQDARKLVQG